MDREGRGTDCRRGGVHPAATTAGSCLGRDVSLGLTAQFQYGAGLALGVQSGGILQQALRRVFTPIEQHILDVAEQLLVYVLVNICLDLQANSCDYFSTRTWMYRPRCTCCNWLYNEADRSRW